MPEVASLPSASATGAALVTALNGDAPFIVHIGSPDLAADLEAALEALDPVRCAVVYIGNPLKAPLTPQRVMLQLAPDSEESTGGDEAGRLLRAVSIRAAGRPSLLVVVKQAETLTPAALALLQLLPELRGSAGPAVRVAFHGAPAFRALLRDSRFQPVRDHEAATPPPPAFHHPQEGKRRGAVLGAASVVVALLLATLLLLPRGVAPVATAPVAPASPSLLSAANASAVPAALPAPAPAAAGGPAVASPSVAPQPSFSTAAAASASQSPAAVTEDLAAARARLYREFNAFVETRGLAGRLSRPDREALFREYLARRYATAAPVATNPGPSAPTTPASAAAAVPDPGSSSLLEPEVVIFFYAGLPDARALADEDAVLLRHRTSNVILRPAPDGPAQPTVRYFRPGDRGLALAIALALPFTTPDWQVVDMSGVVGRPGRPTIEVWLPGAP